MRVPPDKDRDADFVLLRAADEIESLRQQLAAMTKERDKAKAMPMRYRRMEFNAQLQDENESLRQQLAEARRTADYWKAEHLAGNKQLAYSQKREVMLREVIAEYVDRNLMSCREYADAIRAGEPK